MKDCLEFIVLTVFVFAIAISIPVGMSALVVWALCWVFGIDFSWKLVVLFILIVGILKKIFSFINEG